MQSFMTLSTNDPEELLNLAAQSVGARDSEGLEALDRLPAAIYATDDEGRITWFNRACVDFSGRTPVTGEDRWCVTWKLYQKDGSFLPHDRCPMAQAIREKRPVRGAEAIAERPDGTRVRFRPFPTPLFDEEGALLGAVNLLLDVTDNPEADQLEAQADRCLRLAKHIDDQATISTLRQMADDYKEQAQALRRPN